MENSNIENNKTENLQETEEQQTTKYKSRSIVNNSAKMKKIYDLVEVVAPIDVSIHITGEDGCGKDRLAEYIHSQSGRTGEFVIINPVELNDIVGSLGFSKVYDYFKRAEKGTVYISDIAAANTKLQEYLLNSIIKVEQELGMFSPRFISSTNRNLTELSRQNRFNQRLRDSFAIIINIPPLRERKEDINDLIRIIMRDLGYFGKKTIPISEEAEETLQSYDWPGNVRELQHTMERAVILGDGSLLRPENFPLQALPAPTRKETENLNLEQLERQAIERAMRLCEGNVSRAAERLGITRFALYRKLEKLGL